MTLYETKEICIMSNPGNETDDTRNELKIFFIQCAITETQNGSHLLYEDKRG